MCFHTKKKYTKTWWTVITDEAHGHIVISNQKNTVPEYSILNVYESKFFKVGHKREKTLTISGQYDTTMFTFFFVIFCIFQILLHKSYFYFQKIKEMF